MANETILVVDDDTQSRKVLEVSFKKSGYRVSMTKSASEALASLKEETPDLIVSDTDLPDWDGFRLCKEVKSRPDWEHIPFLFLTEEASLPQKVEGLEIGADDYLTRPIYIKEVTTRVEVLLQKRDREMLSEGGVEEFTGELAEITLIDLLQTIDEESRTGLVEFERDDRRGTMTFRDGQIIDARCGKLQGEQAVYRLMLWPSGRFVVKYREEVPGTVHIDKATRDLLLEGIHHLQRWDELIDDVPSLDRVFETDYHALPNLLDDVPEEVGRIVRLFDGFRTLREVIDDSPVGDVTSLRIIKRVVEEGVLEDVTSEAQRESDSEARSHLADWLEEGPSETPEKGAQEEDTSPGYPGGGAEPDDPSETQKIQHDDLATALSRELEGNDRQLEGVESVESTLEEDSSAESSGPRYRPDAKPERREQERPASADETLRELAEAERLRRKEEAKRLVEQKDGEVAADGGVEQAFEPEDTEREIDSEELRRVHDEGVPRIPGATQESGTETSGGEGGRAPADETASGEWQSTFGDEDEAGGKGAPGQGGSDTPRARPAAEQRQERSGESGGEEPGRLGRDEADSGVPVSFQTVEGDEKEGESEAPRGERERRTASGSIRKRAQEALDEAAAESERNAAADIEESGDGERPEVERISTDGKMVREEYDLSRADEDGEPGASREGRRRESADTAQGMGSGESPEAEEVLIDEGLEWDDEPSARPGESSAESGGASGASRADRAQGASEAREEDQPLADVPPDELEEASASGTDEWPGSRVESSEDEAASGPEHEGSGSGAEVDESAPASETNEGMSARFADEDDSEDEAEALVDSSSEASFFEEEPQEADEELDWDFDDDYEPGGAGAWRYAAAVALACGLALGGAWAAGVGPFGGASDGDEAVAESDEAKEAEESAEVSEQEGGEVAGEAEDRDKPSPTARGEEEVRPFAEAAASSVDEDARSIAMILGGQDPAVVDSDDGQGAEEGSRREESDGDGEGEREETEASSEQAQAAGAQPDQGGGAESAPAGSEETTDSPPSSSGSGADDGGGAGVSAGIAEVRQMLDGGNFSGARSRLDELRQQAPNNPDVAGLYLDLASRLQMDGSVGQAKQAYQQYLEMRPNGSRASEVRSILQRL